MLNRRLFSGLEKFPCYTHTFPTGERLSLYSYSINDTILFLLKTVQICYFRLVLLASRARAGGGGVNFIIIVNQRLFCLLLKD